MVIILSLFLTGMEMPLSSENFKIVIKGTLAFWEMVVGRPWEVMS